MICLEILVGLCTKNNEDTISRTLKALIRQNRKPDKIIVCDKSTDQTPEIVKKFIVKTEIPIKILRQDGKGVGDAYQTIYKNAKNYEVFATIQTNLIIPANWLNLIEKAFKENKEAELVVATYPREKEGEYKSYPYGHRRYFTGRNMAIKKTALDRINGWDPNFLRGEDWDLHIRLGVSGVKSIAVKGIEHKWIKEESMDILSKALIKPTSISFIAKYGLWYLKFNPYHVMGDAAALLGILLLTTTIVFLVINIKLAVLSFLIFLIIYFIFLGGYYINYRKISFFITLKHFILNGIGIISVFNRLIFNKHNWNLQGFKPRVKKNKKY